MDFFSQILTTNQMAWFCLRYNTFFFFQKLKQFVHLIFYISDFIVFKQHLKFVEYCEISGFHNGEYENESSLGRNAV
jgi:hypothetical protein